MKFHLLLLTACAVVLLAGCDGQDAPGTMARLADVQVAATDVQFSVGARIECASPVSEVALEYSLRHDFVAFDSVRVPLDDALHMRCTLSSLLPDTLYYLRFRLYNPTGSMLVDSCLQARTLVPAVAPEDTLGGMEAVDMGTDVLWAACNLGAATPWEAGDFYAWGEVDPKSDYSMATYRYWSESTRNFLKYSDFDHLRVLLSDDDAASVQLQHGWRMPTLDDFRQLVDQCYMTHTSSGVILTSTSTGAELVFPFVGRWESYGYNERHVGYYWTSELYSEYEGFTFVFYVDDHGLPSGDNLAFSRDVGQSVRAVHDK